MTPSEKRSAWLCAARRRNELIRLGVHRAELCRGSDVRRFALAAAVTLASAPAGRFRVHAKFCTWHSLDAPALVDLLRKAEIAKVGCDDDLIGWVLATARTGRALTPVGAGKLIGLLAEERDLLGIRSMEAIDESRTEREAREREQRKVRDAARKKRSRPVKRRHEDSLARQQPWKALGFSRATYYRRQQRETEMSAKTNAETEISAGTNALRETEMSVRLKCPGTHVITGKADKSVSLSQDLASGDRLQRSGPSSGPSLGAALAVADRSPVTTRPETESPDIRNGLGEESRPESEAQKKETARLGSTVEIEDPREAMLAAVFPDANDRCGVLEGLGGYFGGLELAHLLGRERLLRLRDEAQRCGGIWNADGPLELARQAAIELERATTARMAR